MTQSSHICLIMTPPSHKNIVTSSHPFVVVHHMWLLLVFYDQAVMIMCMNNVLVCYDIMRE
jgi:hypothetical protein